MFHNYNKFTSLIIWHSFFNNNLRLLPSNLETDLLKIISFPAVFRLTLELKGFNKTLFSKQHKLNHFWQKYSTIKKIN